MDEKIIKELENLFRSSSSEKQFFQSFSMLRVRKTNYKKCLIIATATLFPALLVAFSLNTSEIFLDTISAILPVILATFSVVFMGYVFFQALINDGLLLHLLENENNGKNMLVFSNETFINIMMTHLMAIIVTLFVSVILKTIPPDFLILDNIIFSNILALVLMWVYYYIIFSIIWEIVPFLYNLSQTFKAYAGAKVVEIIKRKNNDE